ncbi:hypothetical protein VSR68_09635 [Paraburkholderia phymatum]|uniref:hypothetical protein n=1 Tax=Paraburkholderia phymatum TaxID=148447 RepID=UPI003182157B
MTDRNAVTHSPRRPFRLFALDDRVLAQNADGKLIGIGAMTRDGDRCVVRLDIDGITTPPQPDPESALAALKPLLMFEYLDGLFTAVAAEHPHALLEGCPSVVLVLDEPVPPSTGPTDAPHRF